MRRVVLRGLILAGYLVMATLGYWWLSSGTNVVYLVGGVGLLIAAWAFLEWGWKRTGRRQPTDLPEAE